MGFTLERVSSKRASRESVQGDECNSIPQVCKYEPAYLFSLQVAWQPSSLGGKEQLQRKDKPLCPKAGDGQSMGSEVMMEWQIRLQTPCLPLFLDLFNGESKLGFINA